MEEIQTLSDDELRDRLIAHGVDAPPVTVTTRRILERKLDRLENSIYQDAESIEDMDVDGDVEEPAAVSHSTPTRDNVIASEVFSPSYRRRPLHDTDCDGDVRRRVQSPPVERPAQPEPTSSLTRYLVMILVVMIVAIIVYVVLNSDPFDANPVLPME